MARFKRTTGRIELDVRPDGAAPKMQGDDGEWLLRKIREALIEYPETTHVIVEFRREM